LVGYGIIIGYITDRLRLAVAAITLTYCWLLCYRRYAAAAGWLLTLYVALRCRQLHYGESTLLAGCCWMGRAAMRLIREEDGCWPLAAVKATLPADIGHHWSHDMATHQDI